jgi:hypothetical protein
MLCPAVSMHLKPPSDSEFSGKPQRVMEPLQIVPTMSGTFAASVARPPVM